MMNLLAIDTSTAMTSVALMANEVLFFEEQNGQKTQAQCLLPLIERLMVQAELHLNQLDAIVFGRGPGSFTGLRIACSIAKGLAYAHDLMLIPVSSLAAIVWRVRQQEQLAHLPVLAVLDARMREMYWAYFAKDQLEAEEQVNAVAAISLPEEQPLILAGLGVDLYWDDFPQAIKSQISERLSIYPSAAAMIEYAQLMTIKPLSVAQAQPWYVRNQVT